MPLNRRYEAARQLLYQLYLNFYISIDIKPSETVGISSCRGLEYHTGSLSHYRAALRYSDSLEYTVKVIKELLNNRIS